MSQADFPVAEYETRLARAQAAMHAHGLDALFFTTEAEMRYFTGFRTLFWLSPTRPWYLVVPSEGKPVAVIPEIGASLMRATWLDDVRTWSSPHPDDDGVSLLASVLEGRTRIGMPMGRESSLRMPLRDFETLRGRLRGAEFVDASPLIRALRMVKSAAEIEALGAICAIASRAFARGPRLFSAGQPLAEAFRAFKVALLQEGAEDVPYLVGGAGPGGYADVISPPDRTPIADGDLFMLDTGATRMGYFCDFTRNFAFGRIEEKTKRAHATLYHATEAALAAARPGVTCSRLHAVMAEVIGSGDSDVGRYGHGLGIQLTEPPSLIGFDDTELAEDMVITLEPSMSVGDGLVMVHEENIVIRDGPPQLLTDRAPPEIPVL